VRVFSTSIVFVLFLNILLLPAVGAEEHEGFAEHYLVMSPADQGDGSWNGALTVKKDQVDDLVRLIIFVALAAVLVAAVIISFFFLRRQKRILTKLRESEQRYRQLSDLTFEGIMIHKGGVIKEVNRSLLTMTGYSRDELLGRNVFALLVHPDDVRLVREKLRSSHPPPYEIRGIRKDGTVIHVEVEGREIVRDKKPLRVIAVRDIGCKKSIERDLKKTQSVAKLGSWSFDFRKGEFRWSEETCNIFRLPVGEAMSFDNFFQYIYPDDREKVRSRWNRAKAGEPYSIEHRIIAGDLLKWVRVKVELELGDSGDAVFAFGTVQDITEKKLEEEQRNKQRQLLERADKLASLGTLAGGVTHEINNPNQIITLSAANLQRILENLFIELEVCSPEVERITVGEYSYGTVKEKTYSFLRKIAGSAGRIDSIVKEMRDYIAGDENKMAFIDINMVVESAAALSTSFIYKSSEYFSIKLDKNLPKVYGNYRRLEQVFINLLQNAALAMGEKKGGIEVVSYFSDDESTVRVEVRDQGEGIRPEHLRRVTDPFFTTRKSSGGTGLGLAMSQSIIHQHRGGLSFDSKLGEGTTVTVSLPIGSEVVI